MKPGEKIVLVRVERSEIVCESFAGGQISLYTAMQPGKLTVNEDSIAALSCDDNTGVLLVADGLGGLPEGDWASATVVSEILDAVSRGCESGLSMRESILDGIEHANTTILGRSSGAATTVMVMEINGQSVRSYHVGDSQVPVTGQRGRLKYQSIPHSPVGYAQESGFMEEQEALAHDERHLISNMVGSHEMRLEIGPLLSLAKRDTLVLGSDGLFDNLSIEEIVDAIRCGPLEKSARQLQGICTGRMERPSEGQPHKPDDLSFILYRRA